MEEGRKYRKTKHPQIDLSALSLLRKEPYYLNKESLQKCSEPGDGIYEFEKWVERDGCQDGVYGSLGKGSKVYFKHDLRSHDGFLAFSYNEEPSVRNLANIGSVKTSVIMETLLLGMRPGEKSWYKMHGPLIKTEFLVPDKEYFMMIQICEIRPIPSFLDRHLFDEKTVNAKGQMVIVRSTAAQKFQAIEQLKAYTKDYAKAEGSDLHHVIALYDKGKSVLQRLSKEDKKSEEVKMRHSELFSQLHSNCAVYYNKLGQVDKALTQAKISGELNPKNSKAFYWQAEIYAEQKKLAEAIESMGVCIGLKEEQGEKDLTGLRQKQHLWRIEAKKREKESQAKSKGFFHKYWAMKEQEEQEAEVKFKEERKAKRLQENEMKEEAEEKLKIAEALEEGTDLLDAM